MASNKPLPEIKPDPSVEEEEEEEEAAAASDSNGSEEEEEDAGGGNEESNDDNDRDSIKQLLEPLGKDQLIELLKEAALKDPALAARISATAESDPAHRKIFVHGLPWDATTDSLSAAFSSYGDIEECRAVLDRATARCKGFGFVLFRSRAAARRALKDPHKQIGGRPTSCQLASFGAPAAQPVPEGTGRKIFVSGIADSSSIAPDRLRAFFAQFGEIEDGPLGYDRVTGKLRGFAIFVYKTVEGCKKALEEPDKVFEGCQLRCQRALEGLKPKTQFQAPTPAPALQPNDLSLNYAASGMPGLNPLAGLVGQNLNQYGAGLFGQNAALGLLNQAVGFSPPVSHGHGHGGTIPSPYGIGLGHGGVGSGGNYGSQTALQGLGGHQEVRLSSTPGMRSQSGLGSFGAGLPPYFGR